MISYALGQRFLGITGITAGILGCSPSLSNRTLFPDFPSENDPLYRDPCAVREFPEVIVSTKAGNETTVQQIVQELNRDLKALANMDRRYLCGLENVVVLGEADFAKYEVSPHAAALYSPESRTIRIRHYSRSNFFHEVGHHIQNMGILAPSIRAIAEVTWTNGGEKDLDPHFWKPLCHGAACFLSEYSEKSRLEDWAEIFAHASAFPLLTSARANCDMTSAQEVPVRRKLDLFYKGVPIQSDVHFAEASISFGRAFETKTSEIEFSDGRSLYVLEKGQDKLWAYQWDGVSLSADPSGARTVHHVSDTDILSATNPQTVQAQRIGQDIVVHAKAAYWDEMLASSGSGFSVLQGARYSQETVIGGFYPAGGKMVYFMREQGRMLQKSFDPKTGQSALIETWPMPERWMPMHVVSLDRDRRFLVIGLNRKQKWSPRLNILEVRRSEDLSKTDYFWSESTEPFHKANPLLRLPFRVRHRLIFPVVEEASPRLGFFVYDIEARRFQPLIVKKGTLPEAFLQSPEDFKDYQVVTLGEERHFLVARRKSRPALVTPITFKMP